MNPTSAVTLEAFARLVEEYNRSVERLPDGGTRFDAETRAALLPPLPRGLDCLLPPGLQGEWTRPAPEYTIADADGGLAHVRRGGETESVAVVETARREETRVAESQFDNHTKRVWREAWETFLKRSSPRDWFGRARVLCFPAGEVEPEVSIYLRLGVPPDRIYAVEGNPKHREAFERNCRRLGVTPRFGSLEDLLPTVTEPFDIVSLDFLGPYHPSYVSLASKIPCADRVATLVNIEAKREGKEVQEEVLKTAHQIAEGYARHVLLATADNPRVAQILANSGLPLTRGGPTAFPEARESIADTIINSAVGFEFRALRGERGRRVNDLLPMMYEANPRLKEPSPYSRTYRCLNALGEKLGRTYTAYVGHYRNQLGLVSTADLRRVTALGGIELAMAASWFDKIFLDQMMPTRVERLRYWSEASRARSPFLSTFAIKEVPAVSPETRETVTKLLYNTGRRDLSLDRGPDARGGERPPYAVMLFHGATDRPKKVHTELRRGDYFLHKVFGAGEVGRIPVTALLDIVKSGRQCPEGEMWRIGAERSTVGTPASSSG